MFPGWGSLAETTPDKHWYTYLFCRASSISDKLNVYFRPDHCLFIRNSYLCPCKHRLMKFLFILLEQDSAFDDGVPKGILYVRRRDPVVWGGGRGRGRLSRSIAAGGFLVPSFSTNSGQFVFSSLFGIHPNNDRCFVNHGTRHVYVLSIFDFAVSLLIKRTRRSFCKSFFTVFFFVFFDVFPVLLKPVIDIEKYVDVDLLLAAVEVQ